MVAMLPKMLEDDRRRAGWRVGRAAWELGVSIREYRELEAGTRSPSFEAFHRICKVFGWPQTFLQVGQFGDGHRSRFRVGGGGKDQP